MRLWEADETVLRALYKTHEELRARRLYNATFVRGKIRVIEDDSCLLSLDRPPRGGALGSDGGEPPHESLARGRSEDDFPPRDTPVNHWTVLLLRFPERELKVNDLIVTFAVSIGPTAWKGDTVITYDYGAIDPPEEPAREERAI